jgi:hypothetical protein
MRRAVEQGLTVSKGPALGEREIDSLMKRYRRRIVPSTALSAEHGGRPRAAEIHERGDERQCRGAGNHGGRGHDVEDDEPDGGDELAPAISGRLVPSPRVPSPLARRPARGGGATRRSIS